MELLVTLRNKELLNRLSNRADGVLAGSLFAMSYNYSFEQMKDIFRYCLDHKLKFYVVMDSFISEDELEQLDEYMKMLADWNVDGIYFHDLSIMAVARRYNMVGKLIYDGMTVLCNSLETAFYLSKGINACVISRELTYEEVKEIIANNPGKVDMQIFGHQRLSYSKRRFLSNYFKEIGVNYPYKNKETLTLIEEQRSYRMPIIEDDYGTRIYSDYVFETYDELPFLKKGLKRGIVDTLFMNNATVVKVLDDCRSIVEANKEMLKKDLYADYPENYGSGFLYTKTNITKDE